MALETDNSEPISVEVVDTGETIVDENQPGETGEAAEQIEIVVEGEGKPTSKPAHRMGGFEKRLKKLTGQRDTATSEAEAEKLRREAAEEETKLWKLKATQVESKEPKITDFDTDAEFNAAKNTFDEEKISAIAAKQAQILFDEHQGNSNQNLINQNRTQAANDHIDRANLLKVDDYDDVEGTAMEALGEELTREIVANSPKSELVLYHLGKNPAKAEQLRRLAANNEGMKCVLEIGRLEQSLVVRPKSNAPPDPETVIAGGKSAHNMRGPKGATYE